LVAIFGTVLGLPQWIEHAGAVVALITVLAQIPLLRKRRREVAAVDKTMKRGLWMWGLLITLVTWCSPVWLPYAGAKLPLPWLIVSALLSWISALAALLLAVRFWQKT